MAETEKPSTCSVEVKDNGAKVVQPCWPLEECLDDPHGRGTKLQGLTQRYLVNMETGEHSRSPIVFKGGQHTKGGLMLNYCPFCGKDIKTNGDPS